MNTELKEKHVTLSLFWEEYREKYLEGLGNSQFVSGHLKMPHPSDFSLIRLISFFHFFFIDIFFSFLNVS